MLSLGFRVLESVGDGLNDSERYNKNLIDVGVKDLAICSNGMIFKNINKTKEVKRLKKVLKRKQRKVSREYEMNKIKKGGENCCQFKKTKNIIKDK